MKVLGVVYGSLIEIAKVSSGTPAYRRHRFEKLAAGRVVHHLGHCLGEPRTIGGIRSLNAAQHIGEQRLHCILQFLPGVLQLGQGFGCRPVDLAVPHTLFYRFIRFAPCHLVHVTVQVSM